MEGPSAFSFFNCALPKWFLTLAGEKIKVMKAHRIGPERSTRGRPRRLPSSSNALFHRPGSNLNSCQKMSDDHQWQIHLLVSRGAMDETRKQVCRLFLLYPAKLKLTNFLKVRCLCLSNVGFLVLDFLSFGLMASSVWGVRSLKLFDNFFQWKLLHKIINIASWNTNGLNRPVWRTACLHYPHFTLLLPRLFFKSPFYLCLYNIPVNNQQINP